MIPFGESQRLFAAFDGRPGVALTEFHLFQHADPTKRKLSPFALLRELVKFARFAGPTLRHASEAAHDLDDRGPVRAAQKRVDMPPLRLHLRKFWVIPTY